MTRPTDPQVETLVARCVERIEDGDNADRAALVDTICSERPELAADVRSRIDQLAALGLLADPPGPRSLPERLGGFRLLRHLGGGGMGEVFLAREESLGRHVALKLIRPELLYAPDARARFEREAHTVAQLSHPGLVPVHASGEDGGVPWLAMELVRGATLEAVLAALAGRDPASLEGADLLRAVTQATPVFDELPDATGSGESAAGKLFDGSWSDACLRVMTAVADCLQHAHERGVLHRDVKPANIMLDARGRVRLLDFGVAARSDAARLTRTGAQVGSLTYMAPEQVRGQIGQLDARVDVYGLGVTLYELLCLRPAYAADSLDELRTRILEGTPPSVRARNPVVARDTETLIRVAMEVEPDGRYASAADLSADARRILARESIHARPPAPLQRALRWARRRPALAAALLLAALILVGGPITYAELARRHADELGDALLAAQRERDAASDARDLAESQRQRADEQAALALARFHEAEAARRRAESNLDVARAAVDRTLVALGDDDVLTLPGLEPARRRLREDAVELYELILEQRPEDPAARLARLGVMADLANVLTEQGRVADAVVVWGQLATASAEELSRRAADDPARLTVALRQLSAQRGEADTLGQLGRFDDAGARHAAAVAAGREIVQEHPTHIEARGLLAATLLGHARWHESSVQQGGSNAAPARAVARDSYEQALALYDELGRELAQPTWVVDERAGAVQNFSVLLESQGESMRQLELCLDTLEAIDEHVGRGEGERGLRIQRVSIQARLANALAHLEQTELAEQHYADTLSALDELVRDHPQLQRVHSVQISTLFDQGRWQFRRHDYAAARETLQRTVQALDAAQAAGVNRNAHDMLRGVVLGQLGHTLRGLDELDDAVDAYAEGLHAFDAVRGRMPVGEIVAARAPLLKYQADVELRRGHVPEAAALARKLAAEAPDDPTAAEDAALLLARCAAASAGALPAYLDDAFRLLHLRLDHGLQGLGTLQTSATWQPLRDDPRWPGVLARFEARP